VIKDLDSAVGAFSWRDLTSQPVPVTSHCTSRRSVHNVT